MNSYGILDLLTDDFTDYLNGEGNYSTAAYTGNVPFDPIFNNTLPLDMLDRDYTIAGIRIGLQEVNIDDIFIKVGSGSVEDWNQGYELQLFMTMGREDDPDYIVEQELLNYRDLAVEWSKDDSFDVNNVTTVAGENDKLYTFELVNFTQITPDRFFRETKVQWAAYRSQL